ncbi:glycoside hydrolase family 2 TIM barrel-domain containing protein [Parapedobacter tibetensis]|uniref:glycoside hydrolase family 2 TIM barrel-domain containing protein n=1 Tax=Parapedobacter tibetensis TaxID=2972951 RepID=UPI00214DEC06|nr:glycoside hydrolase family 2 TIM barrel-domain containing protein [Parapedobacter tibetensis]
MKRLFIFALSILTISCERSAIDPALKLTDKLTETATTEEGPAIVTVVKENSVWRLKRNGQNYIVKGVAASKSTYPNASYYLSELESFSGNTVRTYSVNEYTQDVLDAAYANGISVCLGLWVGRETDGFDYDNATAVQQQLENLRQQVLTYKDHPALLTWGIGNEADASYANLKLWNAINGISEMIHEEDGNHPTTTMLVNSAPAKITEIISRAPDLDFISINSYAPNLPAVLGNLQNAGWTKPYMITEFGPRGTWQMNPEPNRILPWGALVEQTSTEKAEIYRSSYNQHIKANFDNGCLGSFAFAWGYQTHGAVRTWFGFHNTEGRSFGAADIMKRVWSDWYPANRAPVIASRNDMTLEGQHAEDAIYLTKGNLYRAKVVATDPDGDPLTYDWVLVPEGVPGPDGGPHPGLPGWVLTISGNQAWFRAWATGNYRLYAYVKDNHNKLASAVIPFRVEEN